MSSSRYFVLARLWLAVVFFGVSAAYAATSPVRMIAEDVALSVWDSDPTIVGAVVQIANKGTETASNVTVTSIVVQGGVLQAPGSFPIALGNIAAQRDATLALRAKLPKTDGTRYLLTVSGRYAAGGSVYGFSVNRYISPQPVNLGPFVVRNGITQIKHPSTAFFPPPPLRDIGLPNAEAPILIPPGPFRVLFTPTPNPTPADATPGAAPVRITRNTAEANNPCCSIPPDPSAAAEADGVVLTTFNSGMRYSVDGGANFINVGLTAPQPGNPARTSFFPEDDGGLCCDQVVIFLPQRNIFVWLLQYDPVCVNSANCTGNNPGAITQPNRLRVAWATPQAIRADFWNAWTYADLTGNSRANVSSGLGTANNEWLDYPDLAYSNEFLYVSVDQGFPTAGSVYSGRRIVARLSLNDTLNPASSTVGYNFTTLSGVNGLNKSHLVQGAPGRLVTAGLKDSSTLVVYSWRDLASSPSASNIPISIISVDNKTNPDYTSPAPDGSDWLNVSFPGNITGATYRSVFTFLDEPRRDEFLFAFEGGRNVTGGRAHPYVRIETVQMTRIFLPPFIDLDLFNAIAEYDIWNPDFAFGMAALGTQGEEIGMGVTVGGGTFGYPQFSVGYKNDFVVVPVTASTATQGARYGDYFNVRPIPGTEEFASLAYEVVLATPGTIGCPGGNCDTVPRYVRFGRPPVIIN